MSSVALLSSTTSGVETLWLKIMFLCTFALICIPKYRTTSFFLHSCIDYKVILNLALAAPVFCPHSENSSSWGQEAGCLVLWGVPSMEPRVWSNNWTSDDWVKTCFLKCPRGRASELPASFTMLPSPFSSWLSAPFLFWWMPQVWASLSFHAFTELLGL